MKEAEVPSWVDGARSNIGIELTSHNRDSQPSRSEGDQHPVERRVRGAAEGEKMIRLAPRLSPLKNIDWTHAMMK